MKKGFTLIELLAVIIILAVIALIATPVVLNVVEEAKVKADRNSVYGLIDAAKLYYAESLLDIDKKAYTNGTTNVLDYLTISGEGPESGKIFINDKGQSAIAVVYGKICFTKNFNEYELNESADIENCELGIEETPIVPEEPVLNTHYIYNTGMDPAIVENNFTVGAQSNAKVLYTEDYIHLTSSSSTNYGRTIFYNEKIDFSLYDKIYIDAAVSSENWSSSTRYFKVGIVDDSNNYIKQNQITTTSGERQIIEIDLANYTEGENRLAIAVGSNKNAYVYSIWLEQVLRLEESDILLNTSDTYQIIPYLKGDTSNIKYTYESSDDTIATVSNTGLVTGLKSGEVTITVKSSNGLLATCDVKVVDGKIVYSFIMESATVENSFTNKSQSNGKVVYEEDYIYLYSNSSSYYGRTIFHNEKIDFSKYSKIYVEATVSSDYLVSSSSRYFKIGIVNDSNSFIKETQISTTNDERQIIELDLSDYTDGENRIAIQIGSNKNVYVYKIWLE